MGGSPACPPYDFGRWVGDSVEDGREEEEKKQKKPELPPIFFTMFGHGVIPPAPKLLPILILHYQEEEYRNDTMYFLLILYQI